MKPLADGVAIAVLEATPPGMEKMRAGACFWRAPRPASHDLLASI